MNEAIKERNASGAAGIRLTSPSVAMRNQRTAPKQQQDATLPFHPPAPSRASRRRSLRGKVSHRGNVVLDVGGGPTTALFESGLERRALLVNGMRGDVVDVIDQPPRVLYRDENGERRSWTFDQLVTLRDGRRCLVEVKPLKRAMRKKLLEKLAHVAPQIPASVATHVTMMDERDLPRATVLDAQLFNAVRRDPPGDDDRTVHALAERFVGAVSVEALVEASGLGAVGFRAVARLVAARALDKVGAGPLGYGSLVRLPQGGAK